MADNVATTTENAVLVQEPTTTPAEDIDAIKGENYARTGYTGKTSRLKGTSRKLRRCAQHYSSLRELTGL